MLNAVLLVSGARLGLTDDGEPAAECGNLRQVDVEVVGGAGT